MSVPTWILDVQGVGAPLIALGTAVLAGAGIWIANRQAAIAAQQSRTAREKLRLDLFQLRYAVYEAVVVGVQDAVNGPADRTKKSAEMAEMHRKVKQSRFLFDADVFEFLSRIDAICIRHRTLVLESFFAKEGEPGHQALLIRYSSNVSELDEYMSNIAVVMSKYLQLDEGNSISPQPDKLGAVSLEERMHAVQFPEQYRVP